MVFSMVVTVALVTYQRHVVQRTGSLAIGADALHYRGDILINLGVIATLLIQSALAVPLHRPAVRRRGRRVDHLRRGRRSRGCR